MNKIIKKILMAKKTPPIKALNKLAANNIAVGTPWSG